MKHSRTLAWPRFSALAGSCLLFSYTSALGDTYEWVDKNGNMGYADSLESIPAPYRESARRIPEKKSSERLQIVPGTSGGGGDVSPEPSPEKTYAPWQDRIRAARTELEALKAQREKAQNAYDELLRQRNLRSFPVDPEKEAKAAANIKELEQRIRDKEYEITTTIPDEARQAGVPPSVLSQ